MLTAVVLLDEAACCTPFFIVTVLVVVVTVVVVVFDTPFWVVLEVLEISLCCEAPVLWRLTA